MRLGSLLSKSLNIFFYDVVLSSIINHFKKLSPNPNFLPFLSTIGLWISKTLLASLGGPPALGNANKIF